MCMYEPCLALYGPSGTSPETRRTLLGTIALGRNELVWAWLDRKPPKSTSLAPWGPDKDLSWDNHQSGDAQAGGGRTRCHCLYIVQSCCKGPWKEKQSRSKTYRLESAGEPTWPHCPRKQEIRSSKKLLSPTDITPCHAWLGFGCKNRTVKELKAALCVRSYHYPFGSYN